MECLALTTTILSSCAEPEGRRKGCKAIHRRLRDSVVIWWVRTCSWRTSLLPSALPPHTPPASTAVTVHLPPFFFDAAVALQHQHDAAMTKRTSPICRTQPVSVTEAMRLLSAVGIHTVDITTPLTCGGMSRIFETASPAILVKISDVSRGWSKYEPQGYQLLETSGIPCARVLHAGFSNGYLVVVVERLQCTVSSLFKSVVMHDGLRLDELTRALKHMLHVLQAANVTFCDLSPDNIMCRRGGELVLIDPQFAIKTNDLAKSVGPVWARAFDTVHLSLKIQAMGIVSQNEALKAAANAVCAALLGREEAPPEKFTTRWLLHDVSLGLRVAYNMLQKKYLHTHYETHQQQDNHNNKEKQHQHQHQQEETQPL